MSTAYEKEIRKLDRIQAAVIFVTIIGFLGFGALAVVTGVKQDEARAADNNAFAAQCNDRGGVASFGYEARQCIGAKEKGPAQ